MGILLVRHAEAMPEGAVDDAARWLSPHGRAQARDVAEQLRAKGLTPARFVTSPRVRTVQTAELVAQGLGFRGIVESLPSLSFTAPPELAARELSALGEHVAAFGHMPTIQEIAARLTGQDYNAGFHTAEALWIEDGRVVWSVKPR